ncbi:MAG: hypothetical protein FIA92_06005 [Chloroflexi bacterium]|nr:hypothetical protein [Chloroflexota bacterium]
MGPGRAARSTRASTPTFVILAALLVTACGGAGPRPPDGAPGAVAGLTVPTEGVVLADDAVQGDATTAAAHLQGVDPDGTLTFDADTAGLGDLAAGDVLIIEGIGVRKVASADRTGDAITVATTEATIADAVKDGKIGWTYDVAWDNLPDATYETAMAELGFRRDGLASVGQLDGDMLRQFAVPGETLRFVGKVQGFEVEFKLTPKSDKLDFELSASRTNVKVQAAGFVSTFRQETVMEFEDGVGAFFDTKVSGLKGEAEVTWNAFQVNDPSLDSDIVAVVLPFGVPIPFMAGPIPMTLNVKANIRVVPELTSGNASSGGSWKVTYDSDQGFSTNGGDPSPVSTLKNLAANLGKEPTVTAGLGVTGFGVGFEFPRMELQLGHPAVEGFLNTYAFLTLNTYVNGLWTPGTTLTADIPPCQRSSAVVSAIAGYKLAVLGMVELSDNKLLWQKTTTSSRTTSPAP